MKFWKNKTIVEMLFVDTGDMRVVDATNSARKKLNQILEGQSSKIGDIVWAHQEGEPVVMIMFLTYNRIRVGDTYFVTHNQFLPLLQYMNRAPQSI